MANIIPDPDFEGFDGKFLDNSKPFVPNEYDLSKFGKYLKANNKTFKDLTSQEIESFRFK